MIMEELYLDLDLKTGQAICFDFDGVIHKYSKGWQDGQIYDEFNIETIRLISIFQKYEIPVFICSTRDPEQIIEWWKERINIPIQLITDEVFWNDYKVVGVTNRKLPAQLYIDDRAYKYNGQTTKEILIDLSKEEEK